MIILVYHNVIAHAPGAFNLLARKEWTLLDNFRRQVDALAARFDIVPLARIVDAVERGEALPRACALTFDDGYWGSYQHAAPVLEALGLTATFFVTTRFLREDGAIHPDYFDRLEAVLQLTEAQRIDLSDAGFAPASLDCDACKIAFLKEYRGRVKLLPPAEKAAADERLFARLAVPEERIAQYLDREAYRMMSWDEARDLTARGFAVGSHSRTHATLSVLDRDALEPEVAGSCDDLRDRLGLREIDFAYPFGASEHISPEAVDAVRRAGYRSAVTAFRGANTPATDRFLLHRTDFRHLEKQLPARE